MKGLIKDNFGEKYGCRDGRNKLCRVILKNVPETAGDRQIMTDISRQIKLNYSNVRIVKVLEKFNSLVLEVPQEQCDRLLQEKKVVINLRGQYHSVLQVLGI